MITAKHLESAEAEKYYIYRTIWVNQLKYFTEAGVPVMVAT